MQPSFDLTATISRLFVYPVKSCAGVQVQEALLTDTGLELDRAWMVTDSRGEFVTQRELPRMALIKPQLKQYEMVLRAPGMLALHVAIDAVEQPCRATVWGHECAAYDMGDVAAQWFTDFLSDSASAGDGTTASRSLGALRLVRFDPDHKRPSSKQWTKEVEALNQFSDGYPVLVASEASLHELNAKLQTAGHAPVTMERFRPNLVLAGVEAHDEDRVDVLHISTGIQNGAQHGAQGGADSTVELTVEPAVKLALVKPCPRCPIPNVNPETAMSSPEVGDMLQTYRQDARVGGAVAFGMNAISLNGVGQILRVGQMVQTNYAFD